MLSVYTPAKINLFLNIRGRRPDGFHEISSVMQAIGLWDRLDVTPRLASEALPPEAAPGLRLTCNWPELTETAADNLITKAYQLFWAETRLPRLALNVHLEKGIPLQAGLGGGSSDAAAMLMILNQLTLADLPDETLRDMAARLSSDASFFINGGRALADGRGERIQSLPSVPENEERPLIIVKPRQWGMDTATAYRLYAERGQYEVCDPTPLLEAMAQPFITSSGKRTGVPAWNALLLNDFESVLFPAYPVLAQMVRNLQTAGIHRPLLSGSGTAMLGFLDADPAAFNASMRQTLLHAFPPEQFHIFRTTTWSKGVIQVGEQTDGLRSPSRQKLPPLSANR
jgi:4-diphosphocytidyl-2-C-methyl-D-erythritol kinase